MFQLDEKSNVWVWLLLLVFVVPPLGILLTIAYVVIIFMKKAGVLNVSVEKENMPLEGGDAINADLGPVGGIGLQVEKPAEETAGKMEKRRLFCPMCGSNEVYKENGKIHCHKCGYFQN